MPALRALATCALLAFAFCAQAKVVEPCRVPGIKNEVLCGKLARPLDPAAPNGPQIDIHYVVVPALARNKHPDPVVMLAGGPGQSAIRIAPQVLPLFTRLNNRRDIVFVDQRGTGKSAPLDCDDLRHRPLADEADPQFQVTQLARCREQLQKLPHGDLRFYTTTIAMQDLDAVRRQLGVPRVNLVGVSYGTRAALEYQRQFPAAVRRSVIDGVAPPDMVLPASFSTDGQAAFDALVAACRTEPVCATLRDDWTGLLASLPKPVTVIHPLSGQPESFTLTRDMVLGAVRGPLYLPAAAAALPQAIHAAARGRYEPLAGLNSLLGGRKGMAISMGMHFSVVCAEDAPRLSQATDPPGADFGADFARLYQRICADWPRGAVADDFYRVPPAASPVLLLSGGVDPVTPPRHGERVAKALGARARHVVAPNAGHSVIGLGCMSDVLFRFVDAVDDHEALAVDADCVTRVPRPPSYRPITLPREPAQ
ncbi:alpha/beta hydrolase [Piscinibacter sp. XHJ-5]|uniref:alpha/beta hydrolase n=1 Tax=Piscinibacter sp. XHJ-5 TaxID=3037797 RepID=UPI002453127F|nr:alpha/beta hydrolase [Piscinibacter sp. XHJ-5]